MSYWIKTNKTIYNIMLVRTNTLKQKKRERLKKNNGKRYTRQTLNKRKLI